MRIVIVAPPYYEIPPRGYGGTELICYLLAEGLVDRDHDVTIIGAGPRRTRAHFIATFPQAQPEGDESAASIELHHASVAATAIREIGPDVVHVHTTRLPDIPPSIPTVVTVHSAVSGPDATSARLDVLARQAHLVAISHAQAAAAPSIRWAGVVPNGIDVSRYPAGRQRGKQVVFLGRISPYKGTHIAIDAALAAGRPLVIAGAGTIPQERAYFDTKIQPRLGPNVTWVGELGFDRKVELLAQAACLVFPRPLGRAIRPGTDRGDGVRLPRGWSLRRRRARTGRERRDRHPLPDASRAWHRDQASGRTRPRPLPGPRREVLQHRPDGDRLREHLPSDSRTRMRRTPIGLTARGGTDIDPRRAPVTRGVVLSVMSLTLSNLSDRTERQYAAADRYLIGAVGARKTSSAWTGL
jgi:hypothetical protein